MWIRLTCKPQLHASVFLPRLSLAMMQVQVSVHGRGTRVCIYVWRVLVLSGYPQWCRQTISQPTKSATASADYSNRVMVADSFIFPACKTDHSKRTTCRIRRTWPVESSGDAVIGVSSNDDETAVKTHSTFVRWLFRMTKASHAPWSVVFYSFISGPSLLSSFISWDM